MTSTHETDIEREGGERGEGRPAGVTESGRPDAEGRPSEVRNARATTEPGAASAPTEGEVDRGGTPATEHEPGGDL